jgi:hypothetical protein
MPAFTAIGAYVAGTVFGLVGTSALVVGALVATGAAYITSRVINGNPNKGNNSAGGSQGGRIQVPPATNNKIPVVYGNAFINGIITDARLITTDQKINDTMFYCIVLSETCNDPAAAYTVNNVYWNDLRLTAVNGTTEAHKVKDGRKNVDNPDGVTEDFIDTNFFTDGKHLVQLRVYAGGSAAADQIYPAPASGNTQNAYDFWADDDGTWTSAHQMDGLVYAIVRVTYNGEKGFTGLPNMTFQINNTISNPADVWYDYMTSQRYGAGIPAADIDTAAQTAWADFCDEDIVYTDLAGTANQYTTRYSINGPIDTSRAVKENIDIIMQNAGAWLSYNVSTGLWSPIIKKAVTAGELGLPATYFTASRSGTTLTVTNFPAGRIEAGQQLYNSAGTLIGTVTAQLTPTGGETAGQIGRYTTSTTGSISSTTFYTLPAQMLAFTDDNIISGISISSTRLDDLYNSFEAEFFDKHNKDQRAYARNEIDAGDRNPNEPDNQLRLSLDLCNNSMQADLLGQLELRQSRDDLVVEFSTNQYGIQAQAGDVVSIYSELYGWEPKYFRVMRVKEQETDEGGLEAQIQALEYNPDVYTVEPITEFSTSANIGISVYGASPNLPQPPVVFITEIDTNVAIPNFQMQVQIPTTGGPYDEIELYFTEGWDPFNITGSVVPGTGLNGAPVGDGLLTVTASDFGAINVGDDFTVGATEFVITEQLTNDPVSKTFASGGLIRTNTVTLNNVTGLKIGNLLTGTGLGTFGANITAIAGSQVTLSRAFDVQAAGTYAVFGGLGTYIVNTSATLSGTTQLFDLPVDSDYVYLKKVSPEGNNPTFTNGETITIVITEVPANTQTYRRWFLKARMGIKKRFGSFSSPTITDRDGNFRYSPSPTGGGGLNDLNDVELTNATQGDFLWYDGTKWINENEPSVAVTDRTLRLTREATTAGEEYENEITLRLNDRVTDTNSYLNDEGGPAIRFERSSGAVYTKSWVSGGASGAFTVTLNNSTDLVIGHRLTGTGITAGALITNIAGAVITLDTAFTQQAAGNYSTGTPVAFGQISMEWFGTDNLHRFRVVTSTDEFNPGVGSPPPYPNSTVLIESTKNHTDINDGVLYVDAVNNRVGVNITAPQTDFHVAGNALVDDNLTVTGSTFLGNNYIIDQTAVTGQFKVTNNSVDNLFVDSATGRIGINDNTPGHNLDITGDLRATQAVYFDSTARVSSTLTVNGTVEANGGAITTDDTTFNLINGTATTVNFAGAATDIQIGAVTGTTNINHNLDVDGTSTLNNVVIEAELRHQAALDAARTLTRITTGTVTGNSPIIIDTFGTTVARSVKYILTLAKGTEYQSMEIMIVHNGTTSYLNTYSDIATGANLGTLDTSITGGGIELRITPTTTGDLKWMIKRELFVLP